jgi:hypothetical protein
VAKGKWDSNHLSSKELKQTNPSKEEKNLTNLLRKNPVLRRKSYNVDYFYHQNHILCLGYLLENLGENKVGVAMPPVGGNACYPSESPCPNPPWPKGFEMPLLRGQILPEKGNAPPVPHGGNSPPEKTMVQNRLAKGLIRMVQTALPFQSAALNRSFYGVLGEPPCPPPAGPALFRHVGLSEGFLGWSRPPGDLGYPLGFLKTGLRNTLAE